MAKAIGVDITEESKEKPEWYTRVAARKAARIGPTNLTSKAKEIVRLRASGLTIGQIAKEVNVNVGTVKRWIGSKVGKQRMAEISSLDENIISNACSFVQKLVDKSLLIHERLLNGDPTVTRTQHAVADLYMVHFSGLRAPVQVQSESRTITIEMREKYQRDAFRVIQECGMLPMIDVEAKQIEECSSIN